MKAANAAIMHMTIKKENPPLWLRRPLFLVVLRVILGVAGGFFLVVIFQLVSLLLKTILNFICQKNLHMIH